MRSKMKFGLFAVPFFAFVLSSCVKNPVTGRREFHAISEKAELQLGQSTKDEIVREYGLYRNPKLQAYINEVGQKIVNVCDRRSIPYEFVVLDTPMVNAFAVPGVVFITRGILDLLDDEAELASVVGHEVGHITGYHSIKLLQKSMGYQFLSTFATVAAIFYGPRVDDPRAYAVINQATNIVAAGFVSGYGRKFEREADHSGLRYAVMAGYDPEAMISFFKRLKTMETEKPMGLEIFLRTHPATDERIKTANGFLEIAGTGPEGIRGHGYRAKSDRKIAEILKSSATQEDHFERYHDIVGSVPKMATSEPGVVEGSTYTNTELGVRLEFPRAWKAEVSYGQSIVTLVNSDRKAQCELQYRKLLPDPVVSAIFSSAAVAGIASSTYVLTSKDWGEAVEEGLGFAKRTGREAKYPAGEAYVGTYEGADKRGSSAFFKVYFLVRPRADAGYDGFTLFCAAPADSYLDYLIDFEQIMSGLRFLGPEPR